MTGSLRVPAAGRVGRSPFGREIQAVARERDGGLSVAIAFNAGVFRRRPGRDWEQFVAGQASSAVPPT